MRRSSPNANQLSNTSVLLTTTQLAVQTTSEKKVDDQVSKKRIYNESAERSDLHVTIKENATLKDQINSLKKQVSEKNLENEQLKSDLEKLRHRLKVIEEKTTSESSETSTSLLKEKELLENENRSMRTTLEEAEKKITFLTAELTTDEQWKQEIENLVHSKDAEVNEWKCHCKEYEREISNLHEYNKVLNDRLSQMESRKEVDADYLPTENTTESLDREFKFQCMQDRINEMTANIRVIEHEQSKLLDEIGGLRMDKIKLEEVVKKLTSEKTGLEKQLMDQNEKLTIVLKENFILNQENRNLKLKTRELEKSNQDFCRKLDYNTDEYNNCRRTLLTEKEDLESTLLSLNQELHSVNRRLEDAITKNGYFETTLLETKTALQDKITALLVMTSHCHEVEKARDNFKKRLQDMEEELKNVEAVKNELERELSSCRSLMKQSVVENEQNKTRSEHECSIVQGHYQKCLTENNGLQAQIEQLLEINDRQSQLLNESESRLSHFKQENHETETSLKSKIFKLEDREKSICASNQSTIEENQQLYEQVQEWIHKHEIEAEKKSQIENNLQEILGNNEDLLTQINDLSRKLKELQEDNSKLQWKLQESEDRSKHFCHDMLERIRVYNSQVGEKYQIEIVKDIEDNISNLLDYMLDKLRSTTIKAEDSREMKENLERELQLVKGSTQCLIEEMNEMKRKLSKEVDEKSQICEEMQEMGMKNETLGIQVQNLSRQLEFEAEELESTKKLNENLERRMAESTTNNGLLHQQLQEWIYKHNVKVEEQSQIHTMVQNLICESNYLSGEIVSLFEKLKFALAESKNFQVEKMNLEQSLQTIELNNAELREEVEEWRNKCIADAEEKNQIFCKAQKLIAESIQLLCQLEAFLDIGMQHKENLLQGGGKYEKRGVKVQECIEKYYAEAKEKSELCEAMQKLIQENRSLSSKIIGFLDNVDLKTEDLENFTSLQKNMKRNLEKTNDSFQSLCQKNVDPTVLEVLLQQHEQLREEKERLEIEINKLLESNREKFQFLKQVEERVHTITIEMEQLKQVNGELEAINSYLKEQVYLHFKNELDLKNVNTKLGETINELKSRRGQLLRQLKKVSSENDMLSLRMNTLKQELAQLKEIDEEELQKHVTPKSDETDVSGTNETRLINEMENLHAQNRYLRLEVDKLIAHVKLLINSKTETELKKILNTPQENFSDRYADSAIEKDSQVNTHAVSQEGNDGPKILEELREDHSEKIPIRYENSLQEIGVLYGMEKINHEAVQSQLQAISSKNATLFIENLQLRELLKSLQVDYNMVKMKLQETEEKLQNAERAQAEKIQKLVMEMAEERKESISQIQYGRKREDMLLQQVETLNVKLVEEGERVNILQRSHAVQLQKLVELTKSLESRIRRCANSERDEGLKQIIKQETLLEAWKPSNCSTVDMKKTREDNMKIPRKEISNSNPNVDLVDEHDRPQMRDDHLQKDQMVLKQKINNLDDIFNSEEDINQLKSELHIMKNDEHQGSVYCTNEQVNQLKNVLGEKTKFSDASFETNSRKGIEKSSGEEGIKLEIKDSKMMKATKWLMSSISDSKMENETDTKCLKKPAIN